MLTPGGFGGWEPGGICGYYDYEQIHDDLALHAAAAYDFLYDYLKVNPHTHLRKVGKDTKEVASIVFKRFIDIGLTRGAKSGNWNVNGWNMLMVRITVLLWYQMLPLMNRIGAKTTPITNLLWGLIPILPGYISRRNSD